MNSTNTQDAVVTATWSRTLADATADLEWVAESWPDLHQMRLPGPRRRRTRRPLTRAARERADTQARIERAEQPDSILGASAAPIHVGVLDTLSELLWEVTELADRLCETAGHTPPDPPTTAYDFDSVGVMCRAATRALPAAAEVDPECLDDARSSAGHMRHMLERSLTEAVDGQVLSTVCAWCQGRTSEAPVGGERTLVVRLIAGNPLIVCESDACEPPSADCGTWLFGKPAWPDAEWEWLSQRLGA